MDQADYRVQLDVYNGPLELLLYLIRKEEVDIYDIPIAHITQQYLAHVDIIRKIDINLAGEFLVMAATLMEIKSRMLNPPAVSDGGDSGGASTDELIDPRKELVEQLLAYKNFKDAANNLQRRAQIEQTRFPRAVHHEGGRPPLELDDINLFALIDAFNAIMASVGHSAFGHEVVYDDTPISLHQADIMDRLLREGSITLQAMFEGRKSRSEMIGLFLAMLELIRLKKIIVQQSEPLGAIRLVPIAQDPPAAGENNASAPSLPQAEADSLAAGSSESIPTTSDDHITATSEFPATSDAGPE
jgi:segregation and condensation protein A